MRCYQSTEHDARTNLAIESALFLQPDPTPILLIYRCRPTIIIGRNQNPWHEVNLEYAHRHRIRILRRESGGGTVYHDLGNINFSFILTQANYVRQHNLNIIVRALHRLGIRARYTDHNDILVAGKKISGSAFRHKGDRVLHHGTLLCHSNLRRLRSGLVAPGIVKQGVMVHSRPAAVANLRQYAPIDTGRVLHALAQELRQGAYFPTAGATDYQFAPLNAKLLTTEQRPLFAHAYDQLGTWQWRVQRTAPCQLSLSHRRCYLRFQIVAGRMAHVETHCDHHQSDMQTLCTTHFANMAIDQHAAHTISTALSKLAALVGKRNHLYRDFRVLCKRLWTICRM